MSGDLKHCDAEGDGRGDTTREQPGQPVEELGLGDVGIEDVEGDRRHDREGHDGDEGEDVHDEHRPHLRRRHQRTGSRPSIRAISRRRYFWIFPDGVIGNSLTTSSRSGNLWRASCRASRYATSSASVMLSPGFGMTNAHARSTRRGSGMATTATFWTLGWA